MREFVRCLFFFFLSQLFTKMIVIVCMLLYVHLLDMDVRGWMVGRTSERVSRAALIDDLPIS